MKHFLIITTLLGSMSAFSLDFTDTIETENLNEKLQEAECIVKKSRTKCDANSTRHGYNAWCVQNVRLRYHDRVEETVKIVGNANSDRDQLASYMTFGLLDIGGKSAVKGDAKAEIEDKLYFLDKCH